MLTDSSKEHCSEAHACGESHGGDSAMAYVYEEIAQLCGISRLSLPDSLPFERNKQTPVETVDHVRVCVLLVYLGLVDDVDKSCVETPPIVC